MHPLTALFLVQGVDDERERWLRGRRLAGATPRPPKAPEARNVWNVILGVRRMGIAQNA